MKSWNLDESGLVASGLVASGLVASGLSVSTRDVESARETIANAWSSRPRFGFILGTGSAEVARQIQVQQQLPYHDIPGFIRSTAIGHRGLLVCGELAGESVIAMDGRFHLYEGYEFSQIAFPLLVMRQLGVEILFVSNAAGGVNPRYQSGDLMLIESHLDLMFRRWAACKNLTGGDAENPLQVVPERDGWLPFYDRDLLFHARQHAIESGIALHSGVYAAMLGPNYETRAEYRFLRRVGADVVGMSTVPEVIVATNLGIRVLACSIVANVANPDQLAPITGGQVVEAAASAASRFSTLARGVIERDIRNNCRS